LDSRSKSLRCHAAQFLREEGLYETREELECREDVLGRLSELAQRWVVALSDAHGYGADGASARIYTFGSFRLGVHSPGELLNS
jgi:poly(A) polymerase